MISAYVPQRAFVGTSALLFAASTAATIVWCDSMSDGRMSAMHDMPMPGGWTMSMMWMPMRGQSWPDTAAVFLGMWSVMMIAMMLPSLLPVLWRYRLGVAGMRGGRLGVLTVLVGSGYFAVWTLFGMIAFVVGVAVTMLEMQSSLLASTVPAAIGAIVLIAGALQFSAWKAHHLACCRGSSCCHALRADVRTAWQHGLRLGMHCVHSCFGLTLALLVVGMMDLRAMAVVTAAISVERLAPGGARAARVIGVVVMAAGAVLVLRAACGT